MFSKSCFRGFSGLNFSSCAFWYFPLIEDPRILNKGRGEGDSFYEYLLCARHGTVYFSYIHYLSIINQPGKYHIPIY